MYLFSCFLTISIINVRYSLQINPYKNIHESFHFVEGLITITKKKAVNNSEIKQNQEI